MAADRQCSGSAIPSGTATSRSRDSNSNSPCDSTSSYLQGAHPRSGNRGRSNDSGAGCWDLAGAEWKLVDFGSAAWQLPPGSSQQWRETPMRKPRGASLQETNSAAAAQPNSPHSPGQDVDHPEQSEVALLTLAYTPPEAILGMGPPSRALHTPQPTTDTLRPARPIHSTLLMQLPAQDAMCQGPDQAMDPTPGFAAAGSCACTHYDGTQHPWAYHPGHDLWFLGCTLYEAAAGRKLLHVPLLRQALRAVSETESDIGWVRSGRGGRRGSGSSGGAQRSVLGWEAEADDEELQLWMASHILGPIPTEVGGKGQAIIRPPSL